MTENTPSRETAEQALESELRLYCIMRTDLAVLAGAPIPLGKLLAQAGHAFIGCFAQCDDTLRTAYLNDGAQPKIGLRAKNENELTRAKSECDALGIPTYLVTDAGRTVFGAPTVTCLGIGPVAKESLPRYVQRLQLLDTMKEPNAGWIDRCQPPPGTEWNTVHILVHDASKTLHRATWGGAGWNMDDGSFHSPFAAFIMGYRWQEP